MDSATTIDVSTYDNQLQCPLFGTLPGEIRNEIFALALVQFSEEEEGSAYPKDSYWYRPGFTGPRKSSSSLLRACKLAYVEGQKVFLRELEWAFWFGMFLFFLVWVFFYHLPLSPVCGTSTRSSFRIVDHGWSLSSHG